MIINDLVIFGAINLVNAGIIALVCILVTVFAILASKSWHWSNIAFLVLTTIAAVFATTGMASVFKQRTENMKKYRKALNDYEQTKEKLDEAIVGDPLSLTYGEKSQMFLDEQLSRLMLGRGRSWTGTVAANGQQVAFTFDAPRELPDAADPTAKSILLKDYRLYAFEVGQNGFPVRFVGTFKVASETPNNLQLNLLAAADAGGMLENLGQIAQLTKNQELFQQVDAVLKNTSRPSQNPAGKWTLFEKMPQDMRYTFRDAIIARSKAEPGANKDFDDLAATVKDWDARGDLEDANGYINLYRRLLKEQFLSPAFVGYDEKSEEYESLLDRYCFDGVSLAKIRAWIDGQPDRLSKRFEPLPREVFYRFQFSANTNDSDNPPIPVDASEESSSLETDGLFTPDGLAVVAENKNNKDVEFSKDDFVLIDSVSAEGYQRTAESFVPGFNGRPVVKVDEFYVRQLRDFPYEFNVIKTQGETTLEDIKRLSVAIEVQAETNASAESQSAKRAELKSDATEDQEALTRDLNQITELRQQKEDETDRLRQQLSSVEQKIEETYRKIRSAFLKLSEQAFAAR